MHCSAMICNAAGDENDDDNDDGDDDDDDDCDRDGDDSEEAGRTSTMIHTFVWVCKSMFLHCNC